MSHEVNPYESPKVEEQLPALDDGEEPVPVFQPAHRWGNLALAGLLGSVLLAAGGLVFNYQLLSAYWDADSLEATDPEWENQLLNSLNGIFGLLLLLRLITAVFLITWTYRVHINLPALGHRELDSKPVWAVVCWFVPIMNFFCPYQVMHEIWWRSDPRSDMYGGGRPSAVLVQCWWGAWLTVVAMAAWGNYLDRHIESVEQAAMAVRADIVHLAALAIAGLLLTWIIIKVNRHQMQRHLGLTVHEA